MANVNVNITELQQVLDSTPASHNIMLVGNHGIGKSEILTGYFSKKGMPVVALFLGQMGIRVTSSVCPTRTRKPARPSSCLPTGSR